MLLYFCFNCGLNDHLKNHIKHCVYSSTPIPDQDIRDFTYIAIVTDYFNLLAKSVKKSLDIIIKELKDKSTREPQWFPQTRPSNYAIQRLANTFSIDEESLAWFLRPRNIFRLYELFSIEFLDYWKFKINYKFTLTRPIVQRSTKKFLIFGNSRVKHFHIFNSQINPHFEHIHPQKSATLLQIKNTVQQYQFNPSNIYIIYILDAICSITSKTPTGVYFSNTTANKSYEAISNFKENLPANTKIIHVPVFPANIIKFNSRRSTYSQRHTTSEFIVKQNRKLQQFLINFNKFLIENNQGPSPNFTFYNKYSEDGIHLNQTANRLLYNCIVENTKQQKEF